MGDPGWAAAVVVRTPEGATEAQTVAAATARAAYERGRLALREGAVLASAVAALHPRPDVLLVDATGRDHPRGAGLALHLGVALDLPTVGVTHRPMLARGTWPGDEPARWSPLLLDDVVVGAWLRTRRGTRPLAVHAAWRTETNVAIDVVMRSVARRSRTPEPLRQARTAARLARVGAGG